MAITDSSGALLEQQRYYPFGEVRTDVSTSTQTDFGFTFQRDLDAQGNEFSLGLMDYKARFYEPSLRKFIQPDTIIAGGEPQAMNRYAYANNSPLVYTDPTGHTSCSDIPNPQARAYCESKGGVLGFGLDDQNSDQEKTLVRIGSQTCDAKCLEGTRGASIVAGILDGVAWGINALYAIGTDIGTLIQPELYPELLVAYQPMSIAANTISSFAGGVWIAKDFMTGDNYLDIKWNENKQTIIVSGSISQDSIATIVTNAVGWNLREPNQAFLLDSGVLGYDLGRSFPLPGGSAPPIPTFIHPTFSFSFRIP